jgi:DUF1365 family protein
MGSVPYTLRILELLAWILTLALRSQTTTSGDLKGDVALIITAEVFFSFKYDAVGISVKWGALIIGILVVMMSCLLSLTLLSLRQQRQSQKVADWTPIKCDKPIILRCRTFHTRMFPKKHSFEYPYLLVAVPVTSKDETTSKIFKVGSSSFWSLFTLNPTDYLGRKSKRSTLKGRLSEYLATEGIAPSEWSYAYLVTAPRFLGYSFNPVSFWYIYNSSDELSLLILEVNNTFGERRLYLRRNDNNDISSKSKAQPKWEKDFHVSPFNSRKGEYSFTFANPFQGTSYHYPGINNRIVLWSSKGHCKLVARLFTESSPLAPEDMSFEDVAQFITQWSWLGFFTYARIVKEAFTLFFRRHLHVWLRPEVYSSSIGRAATEDEEYLEPFFERYLNQVVQNVESPLGIDYIHPFGSDKYFTNSTDSTKDFKVQVLSPSFYKKCLGYSTLSGAFRHEGLMATERHRTVHVSDRSLLPWLERAEKQMICSSADTDFGNWEDFRWKVVRGLRKMSGQASHSPFDCYLTSKNQVSKSQDITRYRRLLTQQLLATVLLGGNGGVIMGLDLAIRSTLVFIGVGRLGWTGTLQDIYIAISCIIGLNMWSILKG